MKQIKEFIIEKLKINKSINNNYNPDDLNNDNKIIYSDLDNNFTAKSYNDFVDKIDKEINEKYDGFIVCRYKPLSWLKDKDNKKFEDTIYDYSDLLSNIRERIVNVENDAYEIKLVSGHLEFDCINSGLRSTYYIYACSKDTYDKVEEYFDGSNEINDLKFLFIENNIIPIEL